MQIAGSSRSATDQTGATTMDANDRIPVVFIHGLWLHTSSWTPWAERFRAAGYDPITPGWPGEPASVADARARPDLVAGTGIDDAVAHYVRIIDLLGARPIVIGHSFGGLVAQRLLASGKADAAVAIAPAQIKGVRVLPLAQLRSALPALGNPANLRRAISLTREQFRFGFGNALTQQESDELYGRWAIPAPARPVFQAALANVAPRSQASVDTANLRRGPLLLMSGTEDHTVPETTTRSTLKRYRRSSALTELRVIEGRGHSLTVDHGWPDVADEALGWLAAQGLAPHPQSLTDVARSR
jgi:alpha-beta hydrolase superfamily lysophospholipase